MIVARNRARKNTALFTVILLSMLFAFFTAPIPQDPQYHDFADQRTIFGIPHFWNVVTNLPFVIIGLIGFLYVSCLSSSGSLTISYKVFFLGVFLIGFGSAFYHFQPTNETLVWDRIPITITLMALMAIVAGKYYSVQAETYLLLPLILIGIASVLYWNHTEQAGVGDLRLYALVQFLPMLLIPLIIIMYQPRGAPIKFIWLVLGTYMIAKVFEISDEYFYNLSGFISGHALKHLVASLAPLFLFLAIKNQVQSTRYQ